MQPSVRNAEGAASRKKPDHNPKLPVDAAPQTDNSLSLSSAYSFVQRAADTPSPALAPAISRLQGTVGNHAVQRILGKGKKKQVEGTGMMTYAEFRRLSGQDAKHATTARLFNTKGNQRALEMQDIFSGKVGVQQLHDARATLGFKPEDSKLQLGNLYHQQLDINHQFMLYESDPSIFNLLNLFNGITFFKTMFNGMDFLKQVEGILNKLMEQLKAKVMEVTEADGGGKNAADTMLNAPPNANPIRMPDFLEEIGVPQSYYEQNIAPDQEVVDALEHYYVELKAGHHFAANKAWLKLRNVPGMRFVKSLFMAHFPQQSGLGGVIGTDAEATGDVTAVEQAAILTYSGGRFDPMNTQLRNQENRRKGLVIGEKDKDRRARDQYEFDNRSISKLAVKGLNKLPKYTGVAYRIAPNFPLDTIKPGATFADNGFMSASPSLNGVTNFKPGPSDVMFVIHSKTAVNIVQFSGADVEGEVLFRPGTKFKVVNVWRTNNYLVLTDAPAEVQMVMHSQKGNAMMSKKEFTCVETAEV